MLLSSRQQPMHTEGRASYIRNNWMQMTNVHLARTQTRLSDEKMNVLFLNYLITVLDMAVCLLLMWLFNFVLVPVETVLCRLFFFFKKQLIFTLKNQNTR